MKYGDELIELQGKEIFLARSISRLTPAPLINLYVGIIFSILSPIGTGSIISPIESILICIVLMVVMPVAPIIFEAAKGRVDLDVSNREQRTKFFLFSLLCYFVAFILYWALDCLIMSTLAVAYFNVTVGVLITTLKSKVSVHGAGVGGPGMALIYVYGLLATPIVFVWMAVIWARVKLKQHSVTQSVAGVILGIAIAAITYSFFYVV